jgi:Ice-binding-like
MTTQYPKLPTTKSRSTTLARWKAGWGFGARSGFERGCYSITYKIDGESRILKPKHTVSSLLPTSATSYNLSKLTILFIQKCIAYLSSAASFGALAGSAFTSTGDSTITGDLGVYPGTAITGFPPGTLNGAKHSADTTAQQGQADALSAYNTLAALTPTQSLTGQDLGGQTLTSGVYNFASSGQLTGTLTLDAQGNSNAEFVFQFGSTITTAVSSSVVIINGGRACNVYWQVGSSATIGTTTSFLGNILADQSVTFNHGVTTQGGIYALNGAITLDEDEVTAQADCTGGTITRRAVRQSIALRERRRRAVGIQQRSGGRVAIQ